VFFLAKLLSVSTGKDAVTWLVQNSPAKTRKDAVKLGNRIMKKFVNSLFHTSMSGVKNFYTDIYVYIID
jgi:hypothetical protein